MAKAFKSETQPRGDWAVTIYAAPKSSGFYTTCVSPTEEVLSTDVWAEKGSAWDKGYKLVDEAVRKEKTDRRRCDRLTPNSCPTVRVWRR